MAASDESQPQPALAVKDFTRDQRRQLYDEFGLWEKGYTVGLVSFATNVFLISRFPEYYWIWHLVKACVYLPWRYVRFRARNYEWLMLDFCYLNTYFTVALCFSAFLRSSFGTPSILKDYNYELIRALFAFANGALVLAVPMFGNKLVFHDVDNTTSVYIHLSPALLLFTLRWGGTFGTSRIEAGTFGTSRIEDTWPGMFHVCRDMKAADRALQSFGNMFWYTDDCAGTVQQFVLYPAIAWVVLWGLPYYLLVLCCLKGWLERNNKLTLYHDTIQDTTGMGRFITAAPEPLWPVLYMLQHFIWTVTTGFVSILMWNSFVLHLLFLLSILFYAIHNGSTFMFRVVAARHVQGIVNEVSGRGYERLGGQTEAIE